MVNVIIRFSVFSKENMDIKLLKDNLKTPDILTIKDDPLILNGIDSGRKHKETLFLYEYRLNKINDIESCNEKWKSEWQKKVSILEKLRRDQGWNLHLDYEITLLDNDYPNFYFESDFMSVLGRIGCSLSLYFYSEP